MALPHALEKTSTEGPFEPVDGCYWDPRNQSGARDGTARLACRSDTKGEASAPRLNHGFRLTRLVGWDLGHAWRDFGITEKCGRRLAARGYSGSSLVETQSPVVWFPARGAIAAIWRAGGAV